MRKLFVAAVSLDRLESLPSGIMSPLVHSPSFDGGLTRRAVIEQQAKTASAGLRRCVRGRITGRRHLAGTVVASDQAVVDRALDLTTIGQDHERFSIHDEDHPPIPDAVVGLLSALEELGQPGENASALHCIHRQDFCVPRPLVRFSVSHSASEVCLVTGVTQLHQR